MDFTREFKNVVDQTQTGRFQGKSHSIKTPCYIIPGSSLVTWIFIDFERFETEFNFVGMSKIFFDIDFVFALRV